MCRYRIQQECIEHERCSLNGDESQDQVPGDRYHGESEEDHTQGRYHATWRIRMLTVQELKVLPGLWQRQDL